jgi:hypothetical protein
MVEKVNNQVPEKNAMPDWGMAFFGIFDPQVYAQTGLDLLKQYVHDHKIERHTAVEIARKYEYLKKQEDAK